MLKLYCRFMCMDILREGRSTVNMLKGMSAPELALSVNEVTDVALLRIYPMAMTRCHVATCWGVC
nr:hypothetical protein SYMBAF_90124 [Serratia symbiotica]